ncbi:meiotic 9 [Carabus blaptoides fortunei]
MLEFEQQIFLDVLRTDALVVTAKGLNIDVIFTNLLKVYRDPGNLIIVLNYSDSDEKYYSEQLDNDLVFTASLNGNEREERYLLGGIHFVTTRIMVVDLLKKRIPIEKITGIFVLRAHTVLESCQEAFCLRLYRQHNKTGFIKAFSSGVESFTIGFGHVERIMRALFVKELHIWPRFHALVQQTLKQYEPTVVELHIPISTTMKNLQTCILDLMNSIVKELKRINKTLEMPEITVENCISKKFHKILQAQLDCIWYQLTATSKQIIADLKTLRYLIMTMLYNDAVTFYSVLSQHRKVEYAQNCTWALYESADQLFTYGESLVFSGNKEFNPEFCPKWKALSEILKTEIPMEIENQTNIEEVPKVLILCQDSKTCFQINEYLTHGAEKYLFLMALKHNVKFKKLSKKFNKNNFKAETVIKELNETLLKESHSKEKKSKIEKSNKETGTAVENFLGEKSEIFDIIEEDFENIKSRYVLTMSQFTEHTEKLEENDEESGAKPGNAEELNASELRFEPFPEMENMDLTKIEKKDPVIMIQTFKNDGNGLFLQKSMNEIEPNFIIMYHSNMAAIRQIEIYEARRRKTKKLKVYFLVYTQSVEEQSYLTTLRREKLAFEYLIEAKSKMVVPEYQDGKSNDCLSISRELHSPVKNTRHGGRVEDEPKVNNIIIVDMREFRSDLPALIHRRGIDVEPVTISIGDYILTPEICVERKSISDLIGSLNSGRLYQQCTQMTRYYAKPMLLIEFDQNMPFKFEGNYSASSNTPGMDVQKKLQLLTLHFPKLKIVWSPSPYASAQLFEELKEGKDQPSAEYAASVGSDSDTDILLKKYNTAVYDFVQKLPGITSKNINQFLRNAKNLDSVVKMSEEELKNVLGNTVDAKALYNILHVKHIQQNAESSKKGKAKQKYLSCSPIITTATGSSICGRCPVPTDTITVRSYAFEDLAKSILFPCTNVSNGCQKKFNFDGTRDHEKYCEYDYIRCPIESTGNCPWSGCRIELYQHCKIDHPTSFYENSEKLHHDIRRDNEKNMLLMVYGVMFLVQIKVCVGQGYFFSSHYAASLQTVIFRFCNISTIHPDAFLKLTELTYLDLSNNKISTLNKHTFKGNRQLSSLILTKNLIKQIDNELFRNLKSLIKFDIGYNKLERIDRHAFVRNEALKYLDVRGNSLTEIDGNIIKELVNLRTFYHHGNPWICDCFLNRLREIVLNKNIIYELYNVQPICTAPHRLLNKELYKLNSTDFTCDLTIVTSGQNTVSSIQDDNVTFSCLINGNLNSDIKWKREKLMVEPVKGNRKYELHKLQINQTMLWYNLTILHVSQQDEGLYMCWKNSSTGEEEATISLKVQLVQAPDITVFPSNNILVDNDTINFVVACQIRSVPKSKVIWIQNNTVINSTQLDRNNGKIINTSEDDLTVWSNLTITRVNYPATGQYRCMANNSRSIKEQNITVTLIPSRSPNVTILSKKGNTVTNENVTLACRVSALPKPDVTWIFRFLPINPEKGNNKYILNHLEMSNGIYWYNITIINITKQDDGEYKCNAENDHGKDNSSFTVKVLSLQKPLIIDSHFKNNLMQEHLNIELECKIQAFPYPDVYWTYNGVQIDITAARDKKYSVRKTQENEETYWSYLNITNVTAHDIGEYECVAENSEGTDKKKFSIVADVKNEKPGLLTCVIVAEDVYKCSNTTQNTRNNTIMKHVHKPTITNLFDFLKVFKNEYDSTLFTCIVKAFPPPDIFWILNKNTKINSLTPNNSKFSVSLDMHADDIYQLKLFINNVTLENEGEYLCMANNSLGNDKNNQRISQNPIEQEPLRNKKNNVRQAQLDQCSGYVTPKSINIYENPKET